MGVIWFVLGVLVGVGAFMVCALMYAAGKRDERKEQENGNHNLD